MIFTASPSTISVIPPHPSEPDCRWLSDWHYRSYLELDAVASSPGEARRLIRKRLPRWGLEHLLDSVELVGTELLTNSVAATRKFAWEGHVPPVRLWLLGRDSAVGVLVWDGVMLAPVPCRPGPDDDLMPDPLTENGRGLGIVAKLSEQADCYFPPAPFWGKVSRALIS
jgi:anti-sigma regulatory factor (Ser/Thr protein kinase)